jgi:hypothetical protein
MIGLETRPRRKGSVIAQKAAGTLVLLSVDTGHYYSLGEVGGRVWELCDGVRNVAELVSIITQDYDASASTVEADVLELLADMADENLVDGSA